MLWSAYADALGFITELADAAEVRRRIGSSAVVGLVPWNAPVGGKFGVDLELPKGCYSDDTQLRLATCRAIGAMARLMLMSSLRLSCPVCHHLRAGCGRGTKGQPNRLEGGISRSGNFFDTGTVVTLMVVATEPRCGFSPMCGQHDPDQRDSDVVRNIIRNAVITHGHPRGILGEVFHGLCLLHSINERAIPSIEAWRGILNKARYTAKIIRSDDTLATLWVRVGRL